MNGLKYSYQQMPKSSAYPAGMKTISGDITNVHGRIMEDIVYAVKDGKELHLRLITPVMVDSDDVIRKYPVIVHVQGSAWFNQDLKDHLLDFKELVQEGFVIAIVQYRDSSISKIPGQVCDTKDAVRYLAEHAEELSIDAEHIFVSGDSSGGHTAAMCWATWPVKGLLDEEEDADTPLPTVCAFLDFYGPTDLYAMTSQVSAMNHTLATCPESQAMGCLPLDPSARDRVDACSVLTYVSDQIDNAPLIILHGNKDRLVPFEQSVMLYEKAVACQKDVEFYCVDGADHGGAAFYCDAFYQVVKEFLKKHM